MKFWRKQAALLSVLMCVTMSTQASAKLLVLTGNTASTAKGVTILVTQRCICTGWSAEQYYCRAFCGNI